MRTLEKYFKYLHILGLIEGLHIMMIKLLYKMTIKHSERLASFFLHKKHRIINNYLRLLDEKYSVTNYQQEPKVNIAENSIWVFWWQGEAAMKDIVRVCFGSILQNSSGYEVRLLSKDNITSYLDLSILDKVGKGMSLTHLSDYVRLNLLNTYGGVWIDATCFITHNINDKLSQYDFFTVRHPRKSYHCVSEFRWGVSFCLRKNQTCL